MTVTEPSAPAVETSVQACSQCGSSVFGSVLGASAPSHCWQATHAVCPRPCILHHHVGDDWHTQDRQGAAVMRCSKHL